MKTLSVRTGVNTWDNAWIKENHPPAEKPVVLTHSQPPPSSTSEKAFDYPPQAFQSAYPEDKWCSNLLYASPLDESILSEPESYGVDLFVEVGDQVTYCLVDKPQEKRTIKIVETESNPLFNIVNERAPVALALLGLAPGEEGFFQTPNGKRAIRVLKILRQGKE